MKIGNIYFIMYLSKYFVLYWFLVKSFTRCCNCNLEDILKDKLLNSTNIAPDKRQLPLGEYTREDYEERVDMDDRETTTAPISSTTERELRKPRTKELKETHLELKEAEFQLNNEIKEVCPFYKDVPELDLSKMADVWRLMYVKTLHKLPCFKIYIKKTSPVSRKLCKEKYSSFNGTIDWRECLLELSSRRIAKDRRRHFLQGTSNDRGILENIILMEEKTKGTTIITLQEQSPDQWLVTKKLLLMRDCDNGDLVIFARFPSEPNLLDVDEALKMFGEDNALIEPCIEEAELDEPPPVDIKYEIIS